MNNEAEETREPEILVAGGDTDPNLGALLMCLHNRGVAYEALLAGATSHPLITWDMDNDVLRINGQARCPAALFIRSDVFTGLAARRPEPFQRALAWFTAVTGWAFAHPEVRILNRASALNVTNKLQVLYMARQVGFDIPSTLISNDYELLRSEMSKRELVVKPVNGGDFTRELKDVMPNVTIQNGSLASPAIIQGRLVPPEIRVYRINERYFPYQLVADVLDYRSTSECQIIPLDEADLPSGLTEHLGELMNRLQMDFGAADFKACPDTGRLQFLEINNGPMFAAFDAASGGRLTNAIADFLCA